MKANVRRWILFLFILVSLMILNYPFVSQQLNKRSESQVISSYGKKTDALDVSKRQEILLQARRYNKDLVERGVLLQDAFAESGENPESGETDRKTESSYDNRYEQILNVDGNGMMGYIVIPKIDVKLPIYHGVSVRVLERGVGHLYGSSFPVGGETTHAVLSAHRGLPSKELFTDLDQLKEGDIFQLYMLDEKLAYQVDDIRVVKPEMAESLQIEKGKDYITLVTCTPYGVNSHRLLVRGTRIPWEERSEVQEDGQTDSRAFGIGQILKIVFILSVIILLVTGIWLLPPRKKRKEEPERE